MKINFKTLPLGKYPLTTLKNQLSYSPTAPEGVTVTISKQSDQHKHFLQA